MRFIRTIIYINISDGFIKMQFLKISILLNYPVTIVSAALMDH